MADISAELVKELRERTGAGFMDCKRALTETEGDLDKAIVVLRERGLAAAAKKSDRDAREGLVSSYIHTGGRVGVLIEVNCETDFVARTDEFQKLVRDLAVQVAGLAPLYVDVDRIPAEDLAAKQAELLADESVQKKPETIRPQIVEGQLKKWYSQVCLLDQPFRDEERTVRDLITEKIATIGENIRVRRFTRYAARGGAVTRACARRDGRPLRYRRILLKLSGEALLGDRQYGVDPAVLHVHRAPGRRDPRPRRPDRHRGRRRQHLPRPGRVGSGHGPGDRRLHRHARDRHERPGPPGRPRAGRRPDPGHDALSR